MAGASEHFSWWPGTSTRHRPCQLPRDRDGAGAPLGTWGWGKVTHGSLLAGLQPSHSWVERVSFACRELRVPGPLVRLGRGRPSWGRERLCLSALAFLPEQQKGSLAERMVANKLEPRRL